MFLFSSVCSICTFYQVSLFLVASAIPIMLRNLFTEISVLKRWEGMTVKATVLEAASKFKRNIRRSIVDPYSISPVVDGRILNIREGF